MNIDITVVISCDCSVGTDPKDPNDELKTEHTITGKSKYFDIDLNSKNRFLCLSDINIELILILSNIVISSSFHLLEFIILFILDFF